MFTYNISSKQMSFHHRLNILLAGMTPFYFHLVNVCLHCTVTALLMHTCERCVFDDSSLSFLTALLFSAHPIHTEAVSLQTCFQPNLDCIWFTFPPLFSIVLCRFHLVYFQKQMFQFGCVPVAHLVSFGPLWGPRRNFIWGSPCAHNIINYSQYLNGHFKPDTPNSISCSCVWNVGMS